jgi:glycosyltransferase involved in cell wall biosynthesis
MSHSAPLHLLQFVPEPLPTYRSDVSVLFGKYLPRNEVHCHIIGLPGTDPLLDQGFASIQTSNPAGGRLRQELSFLLLCGKKLLKAQKQDYALIQVRDMVSIGLLGLIIARFKGIPFVFWISYLLTEGRIERSRLSIKAGGGLRSRLVLLKGLIEEIILYRVVLPRADYVFVQSEAMKKRMIEHGIKIDKMTAVPMGVDTETLIPDNIVKQRLPGWEDCPIIAYLGTLDRPRQIPLVVDAFNIVRQQYKNARLLLIGDSPNSEDTKELLAYADRFGLKDAVHVTGWLPNKQAWALLAGADAAVSFFPRGEILDTNSPTKVLEYLAIGMPCVGNDNPDQSETLLSSGAGWLTDSSVEALAAALLDILKDVNQARKKAALGASYIEANRSYRVLAGKVAKCYRKIIA